MDSENAIFLNDKHVIFTIEKEGRFKHEITGATQVACGKEFFLVVVNNGN